MRTKIRRRPNARWYLMSLDDDGVERSHGGHRTKREATAAAAALCADAARGRYVAPGRLTVAGYLEGEWLPSRENADISEGSRDVEQIMVRSWILPWIGDVPLQKLSARDLDRLYGILRARGGRPLRGKSVRNVHALLSKALGDAVRRGHLAANPAPRRRPARARRQRRADGVEQGRGARVPGRGRRRPAARRLAAPARDRDAARRAARAAGARRRRDHCHDRAPGAPAPDWRALYVRETTKTRRIRRARVDEQAAAALRAWKAEQAAERLAFGPAWRSDGGHRLATEGAWIVTEPNGYIVEPDNLRSRFQRLARDAAVPVIPIHGARHTYAELALSSGVRLDVVSRQLGHASISTTAGNYLHDNDEAAAEAAELVARTIEGRRP